MMPLELQKDIIYGPINSRRLGKSLGINLMPVKYKLCSFNCVYCHYGSTQVLAKNLHQYQKDLPTPEQFKISLEKALIDLPEIDFITFSGNGEPSLHPQFEEIVDMTVELRNKYLPQVKLAILSNSTSLDLPKVRQALSKLDLVILKLDAGNENIYKKINRPFKEITYHQIIRDLKGIKDIILQTVFVAGRIDNSTEEAVEDWIEKLSEIRPKQVQIYSIDRPTGDEKLIKVSQERLKEISEKAKELTGLEINVY
ncbi:MAG: radical SAM protein [Candidatus Aminicenantia bacterium]